MTTTTRPRALHTLLNAPTDAASLVLFRILFGSLMALAAIRFMAYGWIEQLYIEPVYHFTYFGFDWVQPWSVEGMYLHFIIIALSALGIAFGAWYRLSALVFVVSFTYIELLDKTTYLNHYVLVTLLGMLLLAVPADRYGSVDAWIRRRRTDNHRATHTRQPQMVGAWALNTLRLQIALVYLFAGIAKLNSDWLLDAQPLRIWLASRTHFPVVGSLMDDVWLAYAMSWAGMLYDLTIPLWLMWRPSRPWAFTSVVVFHLLTWLLFPIGIFPWLMILSATLFFEPDWPRRLWHWAQRRMGRAIPTSPADTPTSEPTPSHLAHRHPTSRPLSTRQATTTASPAWFRLALAAWFVIQIALPLRHLAWPGPVNWTEEGFRFSWRVMLIEKTGMVEFEVHTRHPKRRWTVYPRDELTSLQLKMMSTQPDLIHQYAHHLAKYYRQQGFEGVEVRAHGWVAYNGRPSQRFIDPTVDLAAEPLGFQHKHWILPLRSP